MVHILCDRLISRSSAWVFSVVNVYTTPWFKVHTMETLWTRSLWCVCFHSNTVLHKGVQLHVLSTRATVMREEWHRILLTIVTFFVSWEDWGSTSLMNLIILLHPIPYMVCLFLRKEHADTQCHHMTCYTMESADSIKAGRYPPFLGKCSNNVNIHCLLGGIPVYQENKLPSINRFQSGKILRNMLQVKAYISRYFPGSIWQLHESQFPANSAAKSPRSLATLQSL